MPSGSSRSAKVLEPTRAAALARARAFAPHMGSAYAKNRNMDMGPGRHTNVSCLSGAIRHRLILEEEAARLALEAHGPAASEKFVQEVFWRTYWKGWLEQRPTVWDDYKAERDSTDPDVCAQAVAGETGIVCFDAWARELVETGYLHNHARMWFTSIWIFTLKLPWALGADYFLRHLVDGDAASNTLGWRWVAGLQTKGKTYLARADNIETFTNGRFSPGPEQLASEAPPLEGPDHPVPTPLPVGETPPSKPYALLLHEEDSAFETLDIPVPARIYVQDAPAPRGPQPLGEAAHAFTSGALDDAAMRARAAFDCDVKGLKDLDSDLPLYAPYCPTGPLRDALRDAGTTPNWIIRPADQFFWPNARKGFFKFKTAIPDAIATFGWA